MVQMLASTNMQASISCLAPCPLVLPAPDITVEFAAAVVEAVRAVAADEILPRYRSVTAERKPDGSLVTEADFAAQHALAIRLAKIEAVPLLGEEMERAAQDAIWQQ